ELGVEACRDMVAQVVDEQQGRQQQRGGSVRHQQLLIPEQLLDSSWFDGVRQRAVVEIVNERQRRSTTTSTQGESSATCGVEPLSVTEPLASIHTNISSGRPRRSHHDNHTPSSSS